MFVWTILHYGKHFVWTILSYGTDRSYTVRSAMELFNRNEIITPPFTEFDGNLREIHRIYGNFTEFNGDFTELTEVLQNFTEIGFRVSKKLIVTMCTPSDASLRRRQDPTLWFPLVELKTQFQKFLLPSFMEICGTIRDYFLQKSMNFNLDWQWMLETAVKSRVSWL